MDIDKSNFEDMVDKVFEAIDESDFVAFDTEFTGLNGGDPKYKLNFFDDVDDWYKKSCNTSANFMPIQFGICTFKQSPTDKKFLANAFNFYIFPRVSKNNDSFFHCQIASLQFLSDQGFDFNRWINMGIDWTLQSDIDRRVALLRKRDDSFKNSNQTCPKPPSRMTSFVKDCRQELDRMVNNPAQIREIILETKNSFERSSIHRYVKPWYQMDSTWLSFVNVANTNKMRVTISNQEEVTIEQRQKLDKEISDLNISSGFCRIIKRISDSRKPLVGHNLCLDLLHTINRFVCILPESFQDFQELVKVTFPTIIDTKYIWNNSLCKDFVSNSTLALILKTLKNPPFKIPDIEFLDSNYAYSLTCDKAHQAGYDAYMTGLIFIAITNFLVKNKGDRMTKDLISPDITFHFNKLNLMRIHDIFFIDLYNINVVPDRTNVIVAEFHEDSTQDTINDAFKKYGEIFVGWINDTSCFVKIINHSKMDQVRQDCQREGIPGMKVTFYADYKRHLWPSSVEDRPEVTQRSLTSVPMTAKRDPSPTSVCNNRHSGVYKFNGPHFTLYGKSLPRLSRAYDSTPPQKYSSSPAYVPKTPRPLSTNTLNFKLAVEELARGNRASNDRSSAEMQRERQAHNQAHEQQLARQQAMDKRFALQQANVRETVIEQANVREIPTKQANVREIAPKQANVREIPSEQANVRETPTKQANVRERTPKQANVREIAPEQANIREIAPKQANVREIAPEEANVREIAPKQANVREITPKKANVREIAPKQSNVRGIPSDQANVREIDFHQLPREQWFNYDNDHDTLQPYNLPEKQRQHYLQQQQQQQAQTLSSTSYEFSSQMAKGGSHEQSIPLTRGQSSSRARGSGETPLSSNSGKLSSQCQDPEDQQQPQQQYPSQLQQQYQQLNGVQVCNNDQAYSHSFSTTSSRPQQQQYPHQQQQTTTYQQPQQQQQTTYQQPQYPNQQQQQFDHPNHTSGNNMQCSELYINHPEIFSPLTQPGRLQHHCMPSNTCRYTCFDGHYSNHNGRRRSFALHNSSPSHLRNHQHREHQLYLYGSHINQADVSGVANCGGEQSGVPLIRVNRDPVAQPRRAPRRHAVTSTTAHDYDGGPNSNGPTSNGQTPSHSQMNSPSNPQIVIGDQGVRVAPAVEPRVDATSYRPPNKRQMLVPQW